MTIRPHLNRYLALAAFGTCLATPALAASTFIEWSSASVGSGGGFGASVSSVVNVGLLSAELLAANDPGFVAQFQSTYSSLRFGAASSGDSDIVSTITFSAPLPDFARLIMIDVDYRGETVTLASLGMPLVLLGQIESRQGAMSIFPTYDAITGTLVSGNSSSSSNDFEASIFDLSGVSSLSFTARNGLNGSAVHLAVALPASPVPEAGSMSMFGFGLVAVLGMAGRRRNAGS